MAEKSWWEDLEEQKARGETPKILIPKAAKVTYMTRRPIGRPRIWPKGYKPPSYNNWHIQGPTGRALECRRRGCDRIIPKGRNDICCSDRCREVLIEYCEATLAVLKGEIQAQDYPMHLRRRKVA